VYQQDISVTRYVLGHTGEMGKGGRLVCHTGVARWMLWGVDCVSSMEFAKYLARGYGGVKNSFWNNYET